MFVLKSTYDELLRNSMKNTIEQIKTIDRQCHDSERIARFTDRLCDELFKYTGSYEYREQFDNLLKKSNYGKPTQGE